MSREANVTHDEAQERLPLLAQVKQQDIPELSPQTVARIIRRIKALVLRLIPIECDCEEIYAPTSSIITKQVVEAFKNAAGDFDEAVVYALIEARYSFQREALSDPANYDEGMGRAAAAEALARRILQSYPTDHQHLILSSRYRRVESDGDITLPISAIERAADTSCAHFLSSEVCQRVVYALWNGHIIQDWDDHGHTIFKVNPSALKGGFWAHFDPSRITAVPRWQNWLRIILWIVFLVAYSLALKTPDREFGVEDIVFYIQVAGYVEEDIIRLWKIGPKAAISFWTVVNYIIWACAIAAFVLRIFDLRAHDAEEALKYRRHAFYVLAMAAPLVWMKLLTVFDIWQFFGTLQIVFFRMMKESLIFFALLALLLLGFAQSLLGLDSTDQGGSDSKLPVLRSLTEGLLGSPVFDIFAPGEDNIIVYPYGLIQYYLWTAATTVILLNVLIALFGTAYDSIVSDAANQYLVFFTGKTIQLIRAPDQFVYPAPFNLVELAILPLEPLLSKETYAKLNTAILSVIFCPVICAVAFFEGHHESADMRRRGAFGEEDEDKDEDLNPDAEESDRKKGKISKTSFEDLTKSFPSLDASPTSAILEQVKKMREQLESLEEKLSAGGK